MAIVLSVHLVESIWSRPKQRGLLAPYLVVDHNGQQQQTDVVRAANVTAWNQKATFPYVPTSDLAIMAFDAGRHPGAFVAQATVDVAAMLQAGSLSASAPLVNSLGTTIGHVLFDVELSTSSRAIAASLDIPGLIITAPQRSNLQKNSRKMQPAADARPADHLQEEHLSGTFTSFTMPSMQQKQQQLIQQQQMQQQHHAGGHGAVYGSGSAAVQGEQQPELTRGLGQRIARGAHGLGSMLGLSMKRRCIDEPSAAAAAAAVASGAAPRPVSPFAAVAGGAAAAAAAGLPADMQASFDSLPESAGPLPRSLMAKRNSYLNSSNSFSSATAPPLPPGFTAAAYAAAAGGLSTHVSLAAAAAGAAGLGVTDSVQLLASRGRMLPQCSRYSSRASDSSSVLYAGSEAAADGRISGGLRASHNLSSSAAAAAAEHHHHHQQQQHQQHAAGMLHPAGGRPGSAGELLSPLRSSRRQLKLSPSKMVQHAAVRHHQLLQARQQEERLLQQAAEALQQLQGAGAAAVDRGAWDDELAREYDAADAAEKEAILYRQLVVQQAEKQAGTAQVLNMIVAQQQQEAVHSSQVLAALAAMGSDSPRHIKALAEALAASFSEEGHFHREQQQQQEHQEGCQMQQQANAAVAAAVLREQQRSSSASPSRSAACYAEELRVSLSNSMSMSAASSPRRGGLDALRAAGLQQPGSPTTPCTPEFASPEMSFRTSCASSTSPLQAGIHMSAMRGGGSQRMSSCNTVSHNSAAQQPPVAAVGLALLNGSSSSGGSSSLASCGSPVARNSAASGGSSSSKNRYYPEVPDPEVQHERPRRIGRKQWSVMRAAGGASSDNGQASAAAAAGVDTGHSYEVNGNDEVAAAAAAAAAMAGDSGAGAHDKSRSAATAAAVAAAAAGAGRRKSRFNQQSSPDVGTSLQARSEISEVLAASSPKSAAAASPRSPHHHNALRSSTASTSAAADTPAYRCAASTIGQDSGYCFVRNEQAEAAAAADKADRWCMHSMEDAVPYARPPPAFPFHSVSVGPSAPMV